MRVFSAVRHSLDPKFFYGGLWSGNFYPALRELGHEIIESKTDLLPASRFMSVADRFTREELSLRATITEQILQEVREAHRQSPIQLFLSYFYNSHFDPGGFDELRRLGIPSVNFFCNSTYQFQLVRAIAAKADYSWHTERDARPAYIKAGATPVWVQMGADPGVYHPVSHASRQVKACFVGQRYADRDRLAFALVNAGLSIALYGAGWGPREAGSVSQESSPGIYLGRLCPAPGTTASYWQAAKSILGTAGLTQGLPRLHRQWTYRSETRRLSSLLAASAKGMAGSLPEVYANYEVSLNFSNVWADGQPGSRLTPHVRLRDFEAPLCRTCYLTGHTDELAEFYEIGREIDTYSSTDELVDKTRFYLSQPRTSERLRTAGYERARRDHTWVQRFRQLFQSLRLHESVSFAR